MSRVQQLNLLQATSLTTGNLVGSGVFMLPASLAIYGSVSILGWVITSIGAIFLALVFAKLSTTTNESGGPHVFVKKAFGGEAAFWVAWGYWMLSWISNTAVIVAAVSYLSIVFGGLSLSWIFALEITIWFGITMLNLKGIQAAGWFEVVMTALKLIPLLLIPLVSIFYIKIDNFFPLAPQNIDFSIALKSSMFLAIWGFIGLESATVPAKEVKNPKYTIPIATVAGTLISAFVYILGTVTAVGVLGQENLSLSKGPYADLAHSIFGSGNWGHLVAIAAFLCCVGTFNGWTLIVARIAQGAADQQLFPKIFSKTNVNGTPTTSIIISSLCTFPIIIFSVQENMLAQFNFIIDIAITLILFIYAVCALAYFKIAAKYTWISIILGVGSLGFSLFAICSSGLKMIGLALSLLLLGVPFRFMYKNRVIAHQA
jgi:basic amino acid/polyamine antiporter, APA family